MMGHLFAHLLSLVFSGLALVNLCIALKLIICIDDSYDGLAPLAPGLFIIGLLSWTLGCLLSRVSRPRAGANLPDATTR